MNRQGQTHTLDRNSLTPLLLLVAVLVITIGSVIASWHFAVTEAAGAQVAELQRDTRDMYDHLSRQFALLDGYGASFTPQQLDDRALLLEKLNRCVDNTDFGYACFIYPDAMLLRNDGSSTTVAHLDDFRSAMSGEYTVSLFPDWDQNGEGGVSMAVPVVLEGRTEGVLLGLYSWDGFQALFEDSFSETDRHTVLCSSSGSLLLGTATAKQFLLSHGISPGGANSLLHITEQAPFLQGSHQQLIDDLAAGASGQIAFRFGRDHCYAAYLPLGFNDWYILSILLEDDIIANAIGSTGIFYFIIFFSLLAGMCIILLMMYRERQTARLERERLERDDLTGLLSEKAFLDRVNRWLPTIRPGQFCLIYMDIHKFKLVNEIYGYTTGNTLLQTLANDLSAFTHDCGGLCARISSDCFVTLIPHRETFIRSIYHKEQEYRDKRVVSLDFYLHYGICVIDDPSVPADRLVDAARMAQRAIKGNYDSRIGYYDSAVKQTLLREQQIISSMAQALENREFIVYLQPQYNHRSGEVCGAEALVRWDSPQRGLISPGEFIPVFEANGFITRLDEYVWELVCSLQKQWLDQGHSILPVSINVSRADMLKGGIADKLSGLIQQYGLSPDKLRVEITESAYMDNPQQLISEIIRLTERGFTVEMDDFGSGYSSLNMLKDVPFHVLKTDLKFLSPGGSEAHKSCILDNIIRMAHEMGMSVVAEGVETREQADYLLSLDCDQMQGYYFSRPIPVAQYEQLVYGGPSSI